MHLKLARPSAFSPPITLKGSGTLADFRRAPVVGFAVAIALSSAVALAHPPSEMTLTVADHRDPERGQGVDADQAVAPLQSPSRGDLLVAPTRVLLEGRQRSAEITLINTGSQRAMYRVSFIEMRMSATGEMEEVVQSADDVRAAAPMIRYSPRQVVLDPQVVQTVRIQLRKPAELATGEYRSHLLFRAIPAADPATGIQPSAGPSSVQISLTPIYGVSIPIIVRHGDTSAQVALSDLHYFQGAPATGEPSGVEFKVTRVGTESVYGNITVTYIPVSGPPQVLGIMNGVAVYTPNAYRLLRIPLSSELGGVPAKGRLRVTYVDGKHAGRSLGEAEITLR